MGRGGASLFSKEKLNLFVTLFSQSIYNVLKSLLLDCKDALHCIMIPFTHQDLLAGRAT